MIKALDQAALTLIDSTVDVWDIGCVIKYPQAIHYIDPSFFSGLNWYRLILNAPQFEDLCTEYGGWKRLPRVGWRILLKRHPQFKEYRK